MNALGIHVFAGGFTLGVKNVMNVDTHLEVHDLGAETARKVVGVDVIRSPADSWPKQSTYDNHVMAFGNPRCTAFSTVTSSCSRESHGWLGKQTCDAVQLCSYSAGHFPFVVWESVQQAYSSGKPLLDRLFEEFYKPRGYRVCHLFINAASFGNAQCRKRYFAVYYADRYKFNIVPPPMPAFKPALWDAIGHLTDRPTTPSLSYQEPLEHDKSAYQVPVNLDVIPLMPTGWDLNSLGRHMYHVLPERQRLMWDRRSSDIPYSLFCPHRLSMTEFSPTLFTGSVHAIHPWYNRGLTAAEFSSIMGWGDKIPLGSGTLMQLAKGIVPAVGEWIAQQVKLSLEGYWGEDDWESRYCHKKNMWYGGSAKGQDQKIINLTQWYPHVQDWSRFPEHVLRPAFPIPEGLNVPASLDNRWVGGTKVV